MSSPKRRARPRALRPLEALESRQLLARMVSGTDIDGDTWTLRLAGPGDLRVTTQGQADSTPVSSTTPALINTITVAGADPKTTKLIGRVTKGASGNGLVFFQNLTEIGTPASSTRGGNGLLAVDMPNFYLGFTDTTAAITATNAPAISIPDGVNSLRFGGVDTTAFFGSNPANGPARTSTALTYNVNLGLPYSTGTSILVNHVVSSTATTTPTGSTTPTTVQNGVVFSASGRINNFQAQTIVGDTAHPSTGFQGGGGTLVVSLPVTTSSIAGDIGTIKVVNNATNLSVQSGGSEATSGGVVQTYYVGGETNNVQVLAPGGIKDLTFGRGMDTATVRALLIQNLSANRGALNSFVETDKGIGHVRIGGDVVNTKVLSGYNQGLGTIFQNQAAPTTNPTAGPGGHFHSIFVAGDVTDSVFAASVQPGPDGFFGTPQDLAFPGSILAKVEGAISNANSTDVVNTSNTAFFARNVVLARGPVVPPSVPEPPLPAKLPRKAIGLHHNGTTAEALGLAPPVTATRTTTRTASVRHAVATTQPARSTPATPRGPASAFTRAEGKGKG